MELRIGINVGDVIVEGDDLYGDGVNVAARIEALANPGETCISDAVYAQVRHKVDLGYEDLGEQSVNPATQSRYPRLDRVVPKFSMI